MKIIKIINFLIFLLCFIIIIELINYNIYYNIFYLILNPEKKPFIIRVDISGMNEKEDHQNLLGDLRISYHIIIVTVLLFLLSI